MRRLTMVFLVLVLLLGACGDDDSAFTSTTAPSTTGAVDSTTSTAPPTTAPPETSTAPPTTPPESTTSSTTTTTTAPEPYYAVNTSQFFPPVFPGANNVHGSGCVTPDLVTLPNGVWFGFAEAYGGGTITFDLACFYTGPPACTAQIEDGYASTPADCLDYFIRNKNPATFAVPVSPSARVWYVNMTSPDPGVPVEIPLASWPHPSSYQTCPAEYCSVWLYVNGGRVTAIVEQYVP